MSLSVEKQPLSARLTELPPYLFHQVDQAKERAKAQGLSVIDMGVGDPDLPTPSRFLTVLAEAMRDPANHQYPDYAGAPFFRQAVCDWAKRRFGLDADPARNALALIGSKEGIAHVSLALLDPGDLVLVPDPGYPVYLRGARFAGAEVQAIPLRAENGFRLDYASIPDEVADRAKALWINYPNNPTGAVVDLDYLRGLLDWVRAHHIILLADCAYSEVTYGKPHPSLLELPGGMEGVLEFYSLSKMFNMTGWRIGFALGDPDLLRALGRIKMNLDSGIPTAIQRMGAFALAEGAHELEQVIRTYRRRLDAFCAPLAAAGLPVVAPEGTFYVWMPLPQGGDSMAVCAELIAKTGLVALPGVGMGQAGEGYLRFSLTLPDESIPQAVERLIGYFKA